MDLKSFLKSLKLNESFLSMILGAIVLTVVVILVVSYFKGKSSGTMLPMAEQTQSEVIPEAGEIIEDGKTFHIVSRGETLWSISQKYFASGYHWVDIKKANSLSDPDKIEAGMKLLLPDMEPQALITEEKPISDNTYKVVKGDSLWSIAVRSYGDGFKWVEIARGNKLVNPNIIHQGNVLTLAR